MAEESVIEVIEELPDVVKSGRGGLIGVALLSLAIGAAAGALITNRYSKLKYSKIADAEIQDAKLFYSLKHKAGEFADPVALAEGLADGMTDADYDSIDNNPELRPETEMVQAAIDILEKQKYVSYDKPDSGVNKRTEQTKNKTKNVFENREPIEPADAEEFDLDDELDKKSKGKPYIIEAEQFLNNEEEYTQTDLTWFEGDEVLMDGKDNVVRNVEGVIGGVENLKFGYGSNDKNVVYIRNDRFSADYEVARDTGKYTEVVLGFVQHEDRRQKIRKFRDED